jgi:hypothetical protein
MRRAAGRLLILRAAAAARAAAATDGAPRARAAALATAAAGAGGAGLTARAAATSQQTTSLLLAAAPFSSSATTTPTPPPPPQQQRQVRVLKCKRGDATPVSQAVALLVSADLLPRGALHANLAALADDLREAVELAGVAPATRRDRYREQYQQRARSPRSGASAVPPAQEQQQQHRRPALGLATSALEAGDEADKDAPSDQTLRTEPFTTTEVAAFLEVCRRAGFEDEGQKEGEGAASSSPSSSFAADTATDVSPQQQQFAESALVLFEALASAMRGLVRRMPPDELPPLLWALARVYVSRGGGGCDPEPLLRSLLEEATLALSTTDSSSLGGGKAQEKDEEEDEASRLARRRRESGKYHAPFIGEGGGGGAGGGGGGNGSSAAASDAPQQEKEDDEEEDEDEEDLFAGLVAVANEELPVVAAALADLEHRDPLLLTELAEAVLERRDEFSPAELADLADAMRDAKRCFFDARVLRCLGEEAVARVREEEERGAAAALARARKGAARVAAALRAAGLPHAGVEAVVAAMDSGAAA